MSQQINLINTALIKQKDFLTSVNIGLLYGTLFVVMGAWYSYLTMQVKTLAQTQTLATKQLQQTQQALAQLVASRKPRTPNAALQHELVNLVDKQNEQKEMIVAIQQLSPVGGHTLSDYMVGFARQATDGLWMTGFTINQEDHTMALQGRSVRADMLPDYMGKLSVEPVFKGQTFGGLTIRQPEAVATKVNATNAPANDKLAANTTPSNVATAPAVKEQSPAYIEFELQAVDKDLHPELADKSAQKG